MSRTDKDMPYWVIANWYVPRHQVHCREYHRGGWAKIEPCDLPESPMRQGPRLGRRVPGTRCTWDVDWFEWNCGRRYRWTWGPRKVDRRLYWVKPDRARTRRQLTKAKQQYNGSREVEIVERVNQHRHAPEGGGWWD